MAATRSFRAIPVCSANGTFESGIKRSIWSTRKNYHIRESRHELHLGENTRGVMNSNAPITSWRSKGSCLNTCFTDSISTSLGFKCCFYVGGFSPLVNYRLFSSASDSEGRITRGLGVNAQSGGNGTDVGDGALGSDDLIHKMKEGWQSLVESGRYVGNKVKEATEGNPHIQQLFDTHPYLRDVIVPVGGTLIGTLLAWSLLPSVLRRFHAYSRQSPVALLAGDSWGSVPYEKSFWCALESPVRYFLTFLAFLKIGEMAAPTVITPQYFFLAWRGAIIVSLMWFLYRWKTSIFTRTLTSKNWEGAQRDKLLTIDKISSVGLFVVGLMALAEACGVAVQSVLTVGGVGGVATAFAARDILGNVFSGLSVQLSRPFSIGDTIKAGTVEGQVVEIGLTTTSLLTAEKFPVIVPNSLFSSQVIVNKSRAKWRSMVTKIPLQTDDIDMIFRISEDIIRALKSNSNVFLEKEAPYCFLSRIERSYAELTIGCNLSNMGKGAEQDILLQAVRIINQHGAPLGRT